MGSAVHRPKPGPNLVIRAGLNFFFFAPAVHRAKSGRNFAIGAGYLFIFLRPDGARVVFFLPRAPIGFRAGQKKC